MSLDNDYLPRTEEGTLFLPVRTLAEAMGLQVEWDPAERAVSALRDGVELYRIAIGSDQAEWGESAVQLGHAPFLKGGVTYVAAEDLLLLHQLKLEIPYGL